jgi:hypothetical protein
MASPPSPPPEHPLQKHLRRMLEALAEGEKRHDAWMRKWDEKGHKDWEEWSRQQTQGWEAWAEKHAAGVEKWAQEQLKDVEKKWSAKRNAESCAATAQSKRERRRELKQLRREQRRQRERDRKRQRQLEEANSVTGWFFAAAALVMAVWAFTSEQWGLIFAALGLAWGSASTLGRVRERELARGAAAKALPQETSVPAPVEVPQAARPVSGQDAARARAEDPRTARVNTLCDKLLSELRSGPGVLRDVVHQPEQTVEGLRKSCHELVRREAELRTLNSPEDERRLEQERAALAARVASEPDTVVKERLEKALRLVDEQRKQRAELATSASRLEAEHTRLYYTLEHLYTQVLRVRSADVSGADVASANLRQSVEQLGLEMDAVAEALEEVHGDAPRSRVPVR